MARKPIKKHKPLYTFIAYMQLAIAWAACVFLMSRLTMMNFDGLFTLTGIVLGLMIAFTGLMYNRARAYPEGKIQRRSILAAETGLKAVCLAVVAIAVGGFIFYLYSMQGIQAVQSLSVYKQRPLLYFGSAIPAGIAFFSMSEIFIAMNYVLPQVVREKSTKGRFRLMQSKTKKPPSSKRNI